MTIDIFIYMCIIMNMNIYITKDNEKLLKSITDGSMSGLINKLLDDYRKGKHYDLFPIQAKKKKPVLKIEEEPKITVKVIPDHIKGSSGKVPAAIKHLNQRDQDLLDEKRRRLGI